MEGMALSSSRVSRARGAFVAVAVALVLAACAGTSPTPSGSSFAVGSIQDSVALVETQGTFVTPDGAKELGFVGTGFVVDPGGLIITNNHVVTGGAFWKVTVGKSTTKLDAQLVAVSECDDLALLRVTGTFPALSLASTAPALGTPISVAGHPNGDAYTLTNGIVAKDPYKADTSWASVTQEIQITAQTYPGNSGSPVVDAAGKVVGIEYAAGTPGSSIAGESFAIAASEAQPVIDKLKTGKNTDEYFLGLNAQAADDKSGIDVISVAPGSPADKAGIQPGDKLRNLNGVAVGADGSKLTYCSVLRSHPASTEVLSVTIQRGAQTYTGEINGRGLTLTSGGTGGGTSLDTLKAAVPTAYRASCIDQTGTDAAYSGATATLGCAATGISGIYYDGFADAAALAAFHVSEANSWSLQADESGTCENGAFDTPYRVTFPDGAVLSGPNWRLLCYKTTNGAYLEQFDPANTMVITLVESAGDQSKLHSWWLANQTAIFPHP